MNRFKNRYRLGGIVLLLLVIIGLWAKHDADAKAASFINAQQSQSAAYKAEISKINASPLVHDDDYDNAPKQRAACTAAKELDGKLSVEGPKGSMLGLGKILSSKYKAAQRSASDNKNQTSKAKSDLQKYYAICDYYATDNELGQKYYALRQSQEYTSQLSFASEACRKNGCIYKDHYASFLPVYQKALPLNQQEVSTFAHKKCPFDTPGQQAICDKFKNLTVVDMHRTEQYIEALRTGDTAKISQLVAEDSPARVAEKELGATIKKIDPSVTTDQEYPMYISHQLAALEKELQTLKI